MNQFLTPEQEIERDRYLLEKSYNTFRGVSRRKTTFVVDRETGSLVPIDREKDFDPKLHKRVAEAPVVAPAAIEPPALDSDVEAKKARFAELKAQSAWLKPDLKAEYSALKADLGL